MDGDILTNGLSFQCNCLVLSLLCHPIRPCTSSYRLPCLKSVQNEWREPFINIDVAKLYIRMFYNVKLVEALRSLTFHFFHLSFDSLIHSFIHSREFMNQYRQNLKSYKYANRIIVFGFTEHSSYNFENVAICMFVSLSSSLSRDFV